MAVTSGTSWKWNRRTGVTPSCAARVAPEASASGRGRNRRRSATGVASATIDAVAVTESWNPTDHTSAGSITSNASTAPESTLAAPPGRPSSVPVRASPAMTPARSTEGSAPVSTTKNTTVPRPSANRERRPSRSANARPSTGASTIATFPPETTSRCPRPVARKSRSTPSSRPESSPSASPSSRPASRGGNNERIDRPTTARTDCAARTTGFGDGPTRSASVAESSATIPRRSSEPAKPPSSGIRTIPEIRTRSPRTAGSGSPCALTQTVSRRVEARPSDVANRTSTTADHPRVLGRGSSRSAPSTTTCAGARLRRSPPSVRCRWKLPHPTPTSATAAATSTTASHAGARVAPSAGGAGASAGAPTGVTRPGGPSGGVPPPGSWSG